MGKTVVLSNYGNCYIYFNIFIIIIYNNAKNIIIGNHGNEMYMNGNLDGHNRNNI